MDNIQSQDVDLDRTDRLPILAGTVFDVDVEDDAVPMDYTAVLPSSALTTARPPGYTDFPRPSSVDLPSLAESLRSVEERISRQNADNESLSRNYERAHDAAASAVARANALAAELAATQAVLESEQTRSREIEKTMAINLAAAERALEQSTRAARESEKHQAESLAFRDSLAGRDASIAQALHSLGERDAQLNALQREHAQIVPALEARSKAGSQLEAELQTTRAQSAVLAAELSSLRLSVAASSARHETDQALLKSTRTELERVQLRANSHLELLRTREWRRGFDENLYREMDAKIGAAHDDRGALQSDRDQLALQVGDLQAKLAEHAKSLGDLQSALAATAAASAARELELQRSARVREGLSEQLAALQNERARLATELAARNQLAADELAASANEIARMTQLLADGEQASAQISMQVEQLQSEADKRDEEMSVLMAHLLEARRPIASIEADVSRLTAELAVKSAALDQVNDDNRSLRAAIERTRGALEEREFLIRRLERSESNNANVLGRIQTSMERLGGPTGGAAGAASPVVCSAELIRLEGERGIPHVLARRTRIGRAPGCELHLDLSSVSRHHALVLMGPRDVIIEDLNSTNGVLVNGRKVSRQALNDGDLVTIGEVQFRLAFNPPVRELEGVAQKAN